MKHNFDAFIDDLRATHGRNLIAVILYGSAAAGDATARSDLNILVALARIGPQDLRNAHACVREWTRLGNPVPIYFTVSELENAVDVFPIEFHDMTEAHKVLYGRDVLAGLSISGQYLRHQVEYELRSKLLQLRRQYIPASESVEGLKRLMAESLGSFAAVFRAVLILSGVNPQRTKHEIIAQTARHLEIDGRPFEIILNIRENNFTEPLDEKRANDLFGEYMEQVENVITAVDSIGTESA